MAIIPHFRWSVEQLSPHIRISCWLFVLMHFCAFGRKSYCINTINYTSCIVLFNCRSAMKLRESNVFSRVCLFTGLVTCHYYPWCLGTHRRAHPCTAPAPEHGVSHYRTPRPSVHGPLNMELHCAGSPELTSGPKQAVCILPEYFLVVIVVTCLSVCLCHQCKILDPPTSPHPPPPPPPPTPQALPQVKL